MAERTPWRELRTRPHLDLYWADIPHTRGALIQRGHQRAIVLDRSLDRRTRNEVLAHELVHDHRNIPLPPGAPDGLVQAEERAVDREVIDWLVPPAQLERLVARAETEGSGVSAETVCEAFPDVTPELAHRALGLLGLRRARREISSRDCAALDS